jgi:hypothetical protein
VKLRLIVDVEYDLNGADADEIKRILAFVPKHAAGEGHLTDDTPAEVVTWDARVEEIEAPKLLTEIDTPEMRSRILAAFEHWNGDDNEDSYEAHFEHGQWWVMRPATGASWSAVTVGGDHAADEISFEQIDEGEVQS